jgi:hypothetical protein
MQRLKESEKRWTEPNRKQKHKNKDWIDNEYYRCTGK